MKLSVKKRWGHVHVHGGRVLVVTHDHQVSASTYDARVDDVVEVPSSSAAIGAMPHKKRVFDAKWTTAKIGDLAIEIVASASAKLLGYAYLCGDAINTIRYVNDAERDRVATWFTPGRGLRFIIPLELDLERFVSAVMVLKYGGADLAAARIEVANEHDLYAALNGLLAAYRNELHGMVPTTHMLVMGTARKGKAGMGTVHCQPTKHAQDLACQPFFHDLVLSSPDLVDHEFMRSGETTESPLL